MFHAPAPSSIVRLRDMFPRTDKEKIPPDLRRTLSLLGLNDLAGLEERFLATTAFLEPWASFRDSSLLVHNMCAVEPSDITRLDILWFYTQFDEGLRRHDPRIEKAGAQFEIDRSGWGPAEHEKHLYAWLLQTFFVGKTYSPFGFKYLELRNICTAWEEVLVPIIKAVQASYSVKGRRHYGRLALFIEDRCPSRLAFPEGNVSMPAGVVTSPTPFRMVSRPAHLRGASRTVLTRENYDEAEKELRNVYPQFGGLVERPRFKQKMGEWLEEQRIRAAHRKTVAKPETVQYMPSCQPPPVEQFGGGTRDNSPKKASSRRSRSQIKRYSDSIRRSLSMNVGDNRVGRTEPRSPPSPTRPKTPDTPKVPMIPYGMYSYVPKLSKQEPKSPLYGVTRQIHIPDEVGDQPSECLSFLSTSQKNQSNQVDAWPSPATQLPCPELPELKASEQSVHTFIRDSSPSDEGASNGTVGETQRQSIEFKQCEDPIWSPMGAPSTVPHPLKNEAIRHDEPLPGALIHAKKSYSEVCHPSYEGNGYQKEISLTDLHSKKVSVATESFSSCKAPSKPRKRLPAPIKTPPPYVDQLRVASNDTYPDSPPPKLKGSVPWPGESPPKPVAWPGFEASPPRPSKAVSDFAPPIPAKSLERWTSKRGQWSEQLLREETLSRGTMRIVSKENIRAALGNLTPENSIEDLRVQAARVKKAPTRVASPPRLKTFNSHMFPRKDVSSQEDPI